MSQSDIQQLKKQAAAEDVDNPAIPFTSGALISAHVWKLVTTARSLIKSLKPEDSTTLCSVLDGRKRMHDVPASYFGHCLTWTTTTSSVADVVDASFGHVAKLVHDCIAGVSEEEFRSMRLEVMGPDRVEHDLGALGTHDLHITFWRYFPLCELDFGFGKPSYGGRNHSTAGISGFAVVSPTPDCDGAVVVSVFLSSEDADALAALLT